MFEDYLTGKEQQLIIINPNQLCKMNITIYVLNAYGSFLTLYFK